MQSRFLYCLLCLALLAAACRKTEHYRFVTDLALDSRVIRVNADADTTRFIVYAEGSWEVEPAEETPWLQFLSNTGSGKGQALVQYESNAGNLPRAAKLVIRSGKKTDTIQLQQRGVTPQLSIADNTAQGIANGGTLKTPIATNIPLELMEKSYRYETESPAGWVSGLSIRDGYLFFKLDTNKTPLARTVVMRLSYLDALGATVADSIAISQHPGMDYSGAQLKDFAYIKQALAAGVIKENIYIEGIVVSEKGHPNIAKNLNTAANKHTIDKTENAIAVYVQSTDGTNGLYFKTKTPGDNIFNFNDRVKIWLQGATLARFNNPSRVEISGLEAVHIMEKNESSTPLQPREKYMRELTDNDLYTYVKLKDVEISVPSGAFTNINEGYAARMDCYPTSIRDIDGNSMYMLTNLDVPYRRDGNAVPKGSGTITGIIVHETLERYGGNIGAYAIRHLRRADIALAEDRSSGFSNVLVEWSRFRKEYAATPADGANPLTPDIGSGKLFQSKAAPMNFTSSGISASVDYNGLLQEPSTNKGSVADGAWSCKNWWTAGAATGEYWGIEVSSAGISKPLSLQLEGNTDIGGPRNFVVEWSADNTSWATAGTFTLQDVANWSNTLLTQVPGYKTVNIAFPQAASGLERLYIRLRVANRSTGTGTGATGGTLGSATGCRLAHVSIKYNK